MVRVQGVDKLIFEIIQKRSTHENFQGKEEFRPKFFTFLWLSPSLAPNLSFLSRFLFVAAALVVAVAVVAAVFLHPLQAMVVRMYLERPLPLWANVE